MVLASLDNGKGTRVNKMDNYDEQTYLKELAEAEADLAEAKKPESTTKGNLQGWPGDCENPDTDSHKSIFRQDGNFEVKGGKTTVFPESVQTKGEKHP